jgi:hypothetical protein
MPAATPLPRGPSVLTLYDAADLLTAPGCPVCRYASEASDRYLRWFALEAHAQPDTITRLCASLGPCARHTRLMMGQPGAAIRMTAVYRYVVTAARDRLAGRGGRLAACPACDHDAAAAERALGTLIEGLADSATVYRFRELGGVCLPHWGAVATAGRRLTVEWLTETMRESIAAPGAPLGWLAGTDPDAEIRAVMRRSVPATGLVGPMACPPCLASAQAERDALDRLAGLAGEGPDPTLALCAEHLADTTATTAGHDRLRALLVWQAECLTTRLTTGSAPWLRARRRQRAPDGDCGVCRARWGAAQRVLVEVGAERRPAAGSALCVRHHLVLRVAAPRASRALLPVAVQAADVLIGDLTDAFDATATARSRGAPAPVSGAWRRAAAFLDGAVFGGYPARSG